jgi:hypothetical protein
VEKIAELYRTMHVLLIPSLATSTWVEQFGRVIPEAQSSGAVVAGYASGAIAEVAGPPGLLVPEGDIGRLGTAVTELVTAEDAWTRRRRLGLEQAQSRTWNTIGEQQAALYSVTATGNTRRLAAPHSPARARARARIEFGEVASRAKPARPMALPVLRDLPRVESGLGRLIDLTAEGYALSGWVRKRFRSP